MQAEADRWQNLIDDLLTRERHLNASFKGDATEPDPTRFVKLFLFIMTDCLVGKTTIYTCQSCFDFGDILYLNLVFNSFSKG